MISDTSVLLGAFPRVYFACRAREVRDVVRGTTLTEHQARILGQLDAEDPAMVTELAEYMGVTPSTMSLNLKRLEAGGFITRGRDPDDRRVVNVRLTEEIHALPELDNGVEGQSIEPGAPEKPGFSGAPGLGCVIGRPSVP